MPLQFTLPQLSTQPSSISIGAIRSGGILITKNIIYGRNSYTVAILRRNIILLFLAYVSRLDGNMYMNSFPSVTLVTNSIPGKPRYTVEIIFSISFNSTMPYISRWLSYTKPKYRWPAEYISSSANCSDCHPCTACNSCNAKWLRSVQHPNPCDIPGPNSGTNTTVERPTGCS